MPQTPPHSTKRCHRKNLKFVLCRLELNKLFEAGLTGNLRQHDVGKTYAFKLLVDVFQRDSGKERDMKIRLI